MTIDWDIPLSMMLYSAPVDILISRVYVHRDDMKLSEFTFDGSEVAMTEAKAKSKFGSLRVSAFEIINIPGLVASIPSYDRRMMYLMACLGFKGCDYCLGLNRFGFTEAVYRAIYEDSLEAPKWILSCFSPSNPLRRMIRFLPGKFLDFLRRAKPRKADRGPEALRDFTQEVLDMLYVVTYSAHFDVSRQPGGPPPLPYTDIFAGATTLDEALGDTTIE